ncbi:uncharacterized protein FTOL_04261 [Fusarium torulosum]|uniref:Uncharacterized protein n=1 Tax=Fusarium torulosum TaxID=33205 RepID=A0AAE8M5F7_9HYPO|nr:uncharacterized protein FTOL_04261 [Fusarium torulosum]
MATTFYNFSRLPKELRYMIWERALRPDVPGVHFFKMNDITVFPAQATVVQNVRLYRYIRTLCLALPVRSIHYTNESLNGTQKGAQTWWKDGNPSTYEEDPIERELMTFQAGNRRFVEVKYDKEDVYTWREWEEIRKRNSNCRRPASLEALKRLSQNWIYWPASNMYPWKKIRLLGWEQI